MKDLRFIGDMQRGDSMLRVTANTQLMREIVDLLSVLTEEAKMSWGEKGLTVNVVDGSHVALLSATISDACFETYEVEPVEIGLEDFDCSAAIGAEKLSRALRAAKFVGELVDLSLDSKEMRVSVTVEAGEGVNVRFESGELSELVCPSPTQGTYSLQFLDPLTRKLASGLTQDIRMQFQDKYPLRLDWNSNDGGASWTYFLAPRVTND